MPQQLLVITNSQAGTADDAAVNEALDVLRADAWVEVRGTGDPEELSEALADAGDRTIVVAGGDGSIHAVIQCLHDRGELEGRTLGLVPLGTGNDFARTLGIPLDPCDAARVVLEGNARPTDAIVDEDGHVTVNSVHLGAGADAGARGARWKEKLQGVGERVGFGKSLLGRLGYPIGTLRTAFSPELLEVRVEVDGELVTRPRERVLMVAVGNGASVGGGLPLTPEADPHDGVVDVLIATPASKWAQLGYLLRLQLGRHESHAHVRMVTGREVRVTGASFDVNSDGEIDGPVAERTWRVLPGAYQLLCPVETD